jgi:hypothetical protein
LPRLARFSGEDIAEQFAELYGVAWTGEAFFCHAGIMARMAGRLKGLSSGGEFKLYHYPKGRPLDPRFRRI